MPIFNIYSYNNYFYLKISNLTPKYRATERGIYVDVNAKIIFSCNVGMDVLKDLKNSDIKEFK